MTPVWRERPKDCPDWHLGAPEGRQHYEWYWDYWALALDTYLSNIETMDWNWECNAKWMADHTDWTTVIPVLDDFLLALEYARNPPRFPEDE